MADMWVVTMPKLGETVTEGTVNAWLKHVGETVAFDDPLFEVSTDKVDSEIPSPYDGTVLEILVTEGETVPVGTPLVRIGEPGDAAVAAAASPAAPASTAPASAAPGSSAPASATPGSTAPAPAAPAWAAQTTTAPTPTAGEDEGVVTGESFAVTMPKLGETVTEGTVNAWLKGVGDTVAFDDPLFEVSTDKVDSEIPSPYDGTVLEILVPEGETVPVGTPLVRIGTPGAGGGSGPAPAVVVAAESATAGSHTAGSATAGSATAGSGTAGGVPGLAPPNGSVPAGNPLAANPAALHSPVVRRLASEHGIDLASLHGTGPGGRIRRDDVERAIAAGPNATTPAATTPAAASPAAPAPGGRPAPAAAPAVPTPAAPAAAAAAPTAPTAPVATSTDPRDEVVKLSRMRVLTADLMVRSLNTSAHVWTSVEVDFEAIEKVRRAYKAQFRKETGASLSYLPFIARATCDALRAFPVVNSSIDIGAKTMTMHPYVNLGIAVDLNEQGLIVPVVKDADALNIRGVASKIASMAAAGRAKKLSMAEMSGSTFTITNPGPFSSYASSPVINQPNVGILCTDGVIRKPVAVGDAIAVHAVGIIGLVYDHRAFDGSTGSKFLLHLRDSLQDRDWEAELT